MTPNDSARSQDAPGTVPTVTAAYERFMRRLQAQRAPDVVDIEISMAQVKVLHVVAAAPDGLAMSQLAVRVGTSLSTVSGLVERLVDHGYLARHADPTDRRQVVVAVLPAAVELMDRFRELGRRLFRDLIERVADDDLSTLTRAFDILERAAADLAASHDPGTQDDPGPSDTGGPS
jgi:DNA-binding MarR family transcriptional regulator